MRFQKEVNIFAPDAILKRFQANETNFSVVKGKIEALISESEILELQNSKVTMYSKLADVKLTVDGLEQTYTDISSKYDSVSGQYTEMNSKVAEYKSAVDGFSANLTQVNTSLKNDYSTTTTMNTVIQEKIDALSLSVSQTYATQNVVGQLKSWKEEASLKITDSAIVSTVTKSAEWTEKADKASLISQINQSAEQIKIRASIIDLQGNRGCAEYVEHLGIQENPKGQGWAAGRNYGQKIISILNSILSIKTSKTEKESTTMNINTSLISNNNSYAGQKPAYIVIHNTDNYAKGANAKAHAKAQHDGNFKGYSAHVYVDDTEAYQALPYNRGAWHVGVNYGGRLFGTVNNRNSVGIEMCVQAGYNYEKAFQNTVQVCKQLMKQLGIPADRVVQHYDVCAKNCPSAIRAKGDWNRFKQLIGAKTATPTVDKYYRTRKSWADSKSQIGAYKSLENAKKEWKQGYTIYDWNGKAVYPVQTSKKAVVLTGKFEAQLPIIRKGNSGVAVSVLQSVLGVTVDGNFGDDTETSLKVFQKNTGVKVSGTCGIDSWKRVIEHMKTNTK